MTNFFSPNIAIGGSWQKCLSALMAQLKKKKIAVEDTFVLQDFNPAKPGTATPDFGSMTVSSLSINAARYLILNKLVLLEVALVATLAAPMGTSVTIYHPWKWKNYRFELVSIQDGGTYVPGMILMLPGENNFRVTTLTPLAPYAAGLWGVWFSMIGEIE